MPQGSLRVIGSKRPICRLDHNGRRLKAATNGLIGLAQYAVVASEAILEATCAAAVWCC